MTSLLIKIAVLLALIGGIYYYGYSNGVEHEHLKFLKFQVDADKKYKKLQEEKAKVTIKEVTVYVDRIKIVKEKEYVYIDKAKNDLPSTCNMSNGWVYLHDSSVRGTETESSRVADATSSGVKDNQALGTVIQNYSICKQNAEQLKSLQKWISENQKVIDEVNNK
jgi:hypothetical protein